MKVTVSFDNVRVVVPCGDGNLLVRDLMHEAILRYKKATGKNDSNLAINSLSSLTGGGLLDPDDRLCDVADDREQIVAHFHSYNISHAGGDGASSVGTNSPEFFYPDNKDQLYTIDGHSLPNIKRESTKRLSMHALSTREPCLTTYSAQSLPRESRRREPLGQDAKTLYEFANVALEPINHGEICEIVIKNEAGPLGLHVVPCYDLSGNDQGLRVEGIEPNGRIARDGQIDLHDKIVKINGHNLLHVPFTKIQEIFRACMNEPCLKISIIKHKNQSNLKLLQKTKSICMNSEKSDNDDSIKKLQCSNHNLLQTANTRKIGRMIEIELTKGSNGLGFSVTTRDNPAGGHCPIYIKNILPKGAAVEDGRLKSGDRLLEVNNKEMTGKSQSEVVSLLRSIPPGGKVKIVVSRQEESTSSIPDSQCTSTSKQQSPDVSDSSKYWNSLNTTPIKKDNNNAQEKPSTYLYEKNSYKPTKPAEEIVLSPKKNRIILTLDIPVHDSEKAGLGVSVKGKTSNNDDTNMDLGIFIKSVLHGGAASRDGRLRTNDQLLNVNGVSLLGLSNSEAMETLRRAMLNTNSSVTGVITLTIARRISSYDANEKCFVEAPSQHKLESTNGMYMSESKKLNDGKIKEKNNLNSQTDILESGNLLSSVSASPWNPVIDRLTEQYNKNSLRNESYCLATNKTWMEPTNSNIKKITLGHKEEHVESVLLEESSKDNSLQNDAKKTVDDRDSQYSGDPTYDSQLSLEEFNTTSNKFSRDALGRQSMSEKRHAALDAKNTDTYKRNKKLREGRENKNTEQSNRSNDSENRTRRSMKAEKIEKTGSKIIAEKTISDSNVRTYEKNSVDPAQSEYVYTIPGCNKYISPRKHWLVDNVQGEISNSNNTKDEREGFSNTRGDVKQASLNSALDERYKRSRKKGGIRSMLRLAKNRKSLNFGDNIDTRHETSNYCSGTINYIA